MDIDPVSPTPAAGSSPLPVQSAKPYGVDPLVEDTPERRAYLQLCNKNSINELCAVIGMNCHLADKQFRLAATYGILTAMTKSGVVVTGPVLVSPTTTTKKPTPETIAPFYDIAPKPGPQDVQALLEQRTRITAALATVEKKYQTLVRTTKFLSKLIEEIRASHPHLPPDSAVGSFSANTPPASSSSSSPAKPPPATAEPGKDSETEAEKEALHKQQEILRKQQELLMEQHSLFLRGVRDEAARGPPLPPLVKAAAAPHPPSYPPPSSSSSGKVRRIPAAVAHKADGDPYSVDEIIGHPEARETVHGKGLTQKAVVAWLSSADNCGDIQQYTDNETGALVEGVPLYYVVNSINKQGAKYNASNTEKAIMSILFGTSMKDLANSYFGLDKEGRRWIKSSTWKTLLATHPPQ